VKRRPDFRPCSGAGLSLGVRSPPAAAVDPCAQPGVSGRTIAYLSWPLVSRPCCLCVLVVEVVCLCEEVARRSWMAGGWWRDGLCVAPWTPLLIWARGREAWRPVT